MSITPRKRAPSSSPPTTQKLAKTERSASYVAEYLQRWHERNERNGSNQRGGGYQTITDMQIMNNLREIARMKRADAEACRRLREFIVAYGVVRTFKGLSEENAEILIPVVKHLQQTVRTQSVVDRVEALANACAEAGFSKNVSFASKAIAMLGECTPIYSSEGKAYLGLPSSGVSYADYYEGWMKAYSVHGARYEDAARCQLKDIDAETYRPTNQWFGMRGFDVMVMAVGGPLRPAGRSEMLLGTPTRCRCCVSQCH